MQRRSTPFLTISVGSASVKPVWLARCPSRGIDQEVWTGRHRERETAMNQDEIKFCPGCGAKGVATREITPNHIVELYCPHCGVLAILLGEIAN